MFIDIVSLYGNVSLILLVLFISLFVLISPLVNRRYDEEKVFEYRRRTILLPDLARNILYIMVMWLIYFISCEITYNRLGLRITADISKLSKTDIGAEYANQLSERYMSQAHSFYGYAFFIILSFSLYLAGKLVREIDSSNTFHKVLYIILISISPVLMIIGLTNERGFDSLMPLFSVIMAAVTLLVVIIFIRDWKKSDMRG